MYLSEQNQSEANLKKMHDWGVLSNGNSNSYLRGFFSSHPIK